MSSPHQDLFRSLRALEEATFPKVCRNCGHRYEDAAELAATRQVRPDHRAEGEHRRGWRLGCRGVSHRALRLDPA